MVLAVALLSFVVFWTTGKGDEKERLPKLWKRMNIGGWMRRHYVAIVFALGGAAIVAAIYFYVAEVGIAVARLVDRLRIGAAGDLTPEDAKNLAYGIAVLLGALVAAATIPFTLLRTWINERSTTAQEQGLITDRINKAVEGLGAEKVVSRIGRQVFVRPSESHAAFQRVIGGTNQIRRMQWLYGGTVHQFGGTIDKEGDWQVFSETKPNLEVRIGAIYALQRILQDSPRDHNQILQILCAYIRENAGLNPVLFDPDVCDDCLKPREDVNAAIKVIGRHTGRLTNALREGLQNSNRQPRLDLQNIDLIGADLRHLQFANVDFSGSSFSHSNLANVRFKNAILEGCSFFKADTENALVDGKSSFQRSLFGGQKSLEILKPLSRDKVLWCALKSTTFSEQKELDSLRENKQTILSVWFGDGSVEWPYPKPGERPVEPPIHWPQSALDWDSFKSEWENWQRKGFNYDPPHLQPTTP